MGCCVADDPDFVRALDWLEREDPVVVTHRLLRFAGDDVPLSHWRRRDLREQVYGPGDAGYGCIQGSIPRRRETV